MRRTQEIVRGLARLARRPQSRTPRPAGDSMKTEPWATDDPLADAPRINVGPAVVADLNTLRAANRPVVLSDGEQELVVMIPVEQYRAQQLALARQRAEAGARQTATAASVARSAVLDPSEIDALLADWDHSQAPAPVGPVGQSAGPGGDRGRSVRLSDPPRRRSRSRR